MSDDPEENLEKQLVLDFFKMKPGGFFVEVGANDPQAGSQTWLLEQKGWGGILIEPQSKMCERLRQQRKSSRVVQAACSSPGKQGEAVLHIAAVHPCSRLEKPLHSNGMRFEGSEKVRVMTLDEIVAEAGNPRIDFLSIDVEGMEVQVMRGFSFARHFPTLVLIEDGVQTLEKHRYLSRQNYKLVKRTSINNWYIPREHEFRMTSVAERLELFRKMYLGLPFRKVRLALRRYSRRHQVS